MAVPSGLDFADCLAALLRGFHPRRWLLCLLGLVLTGLITMEAKSHFDHKPLDLPSWWQQPIEHVQALWAEILGASLGRTIFFGGALLAFNTALWCLIGGWIARHELVARAQGPYSIPVARVEPSATAFLTGWWKSLLMCCPFILLLGLLTLIPVVFAGWVNTWFGGPGAIVVSMLLPVVLAANLVLLFLALGAVAWPLMPVAVAAECSDSFDALSRAYACVFQRPVQFLLLTVIALGWAGLPLAVLHLFAKPVIALQPGIWPTFFWLGSALSVSIFWSLETLVYLYLRAAIDDVDASQVAFKSPPGDTPKPPPPEDTSKTPTMDAAEVPATQDAGCAVKRSFLRRIITRLAIAFGSWWLTFWLFTHVSRGHTEWLGWGMGKTFVPPAEGLYKVASVIAGLWGVAWLALPLLLPSLVRRASRDKGNRHLQDPSPKT